MSAPNTHYHQQAHTLDENVEMPPVEEAGPTVGHWPEEAEAVKGAHDAHREAAKAERQEAADRAADFAERDPKPKPSEMLAESGREPAQDTEPGTTGGTSGAASTGSSSTSEQADDQEQDQEQDEDQVPDGTTQEVLDWVGDDSGRAQQALDAENAKSTPRVTLVAELEKRAA